MNYKLLYNMARLAKILSELECLDIPDRCFNIPYGVRIIIAEYAEMTDKERTLYLLHRNNGEICCYTNKNGFKQILRLRISERWEDTIALWDGLKNKYDCHYTTQTMARKLRARFWTGNADGRRAHKLAPLWQQFYEMWSML